MTQSKNQDMIDDLMSDPEVVIVDDEEQVAELNRHRVEEVGYTTETAFGGQQALDVISTNTDVVLLDRRMPKMSGDEVLKEIHDIGYNCQIIMVTAVDPDMEITGMSFDDYISKPVGRDTLIQAVRKQMNIKQLNIVTNNILSTESKIEVLEQNNPKSSLENEDEYNDLKRDLKELSTKKKQLEKAVKD